jgi:WD40 repeat protein
MAKFDVGGDVVWLDWTEDGRELLALSNTGTMTRWSWAATQPIDAIRSSAYGERVVIDPRKSLLTCASDGVLGVWDISAPTRCR